jgi:ABC-2 type transport system permease protein
MTAVFRAELIKLARRPVLVGAAIGAIVFAVVTSLMVFLTAAADGPPVGRSATLETLAEPGGGSEAFALGVSFTGLLVLVVFVANFTGEYSRGTLRTLLMREPRRVRLVAGKMTALLAFAALVLAVAGALTWIASIALAPSQGVPPDEWLTLGGLADNLADYGTALATVAGWATLGMALGVLLRSTPVALAIGVAWAGPFEHLTEDGWSAADSWFPGLLLENLAAGGTADVSQSRALLLVGLYSAAAAALAALVFRRRDVTAQ